MPFQYVGRHELADGPVEETQFFLSQGDAAVTVRKGEAIGSEYRFDGFDGQGNLQFVYLPLGTKQLLSIGAQP
ncbi:hypothetical protein ASF45_27790 [Pseudorhodoferax sp. Leaf265]|nr:hypothetical protein ASF45_27790 [Pseudorhodoferax sp. Leaf265]